MADPHLLQRFIDAQADTYGDAAEELRQGAKRGHWMWYVFPQLAGLGHSATAQRYALRSLDEARAYLAHPVLGPRLRACTALMLAVEGRTARQILSSPDDMKFHSSMTLFALAAPDDADFKAALARYFGSIPDAATLHLLGL
jgi:uncharacterized protein (DUF1810 family)